MMGTLASVASLTFCLAMAATSAFVLRVPKVTPPPLPHPSLRRQALGVDGGETGAGGALSRGGGNDGAEAKKIILPWVPFVENYVEVRSRITRPLHVFMGVEAEIIGGGNATVPIDRGVMGEEAGSSRVTAAPQHGVQDVRDEGQHSSLVTVTFEELSFLQINSWGIETSVIDHIGFAGRESVSTQKEDGDRCSTRGASKDAGLATYTSLERRDLLTGGIDFNEGSLLDLADDGGMDGMSLVTAQDSAPDETTAMFHYSEDSAFHEEFPFELAAHSLIDELNSGPFDHVMTRYAADDGMTSVLQGDSFDGAASGGTPKAVTIDDRVDGMVWSVIEDALTGGEGASEDLMLDDDAMDDLIWSMAHDAISGRVDSEPAKLHVPLDEMVSSMMENAFFGPAASKGRYSSREETPVGSDAGRSEDTPMYTPKNVNGFDGNNSIREVHDHNPSSAVEDDHEAGDSNPDGEAAVVRRARKGGRKWPRKLWGRVRRKGR